MQTLSMRDAMTARHSAAVARYAREVARLLGLSEREQELIHTAGLFHDIGKFIFPDSILVADRKLTDEEWEIVKLHPSRAPSSSAASRATALSPTSCSATTSGSTGRGYPYGLSGEHIPLGSRILAAADTYDVMTARDSYRDPVSSEEASPSFAGSSGTQLDPLVVDVFIELIERPWRRVPPHRRGRLREGAAFDRRVSDYARRRPPP